MTLLDFIKQNRNELEQSINRVLNYVPSTASCMCPYSGTNHMHTDGTRLNRSEIRQWILNDESLYRWARSSGVRI